MSARARSALPVIAIFASSLCLSVLPNSAASAAQPCLAAPNAPAPQGSHWYYRIERPSLRKCWRLVQKDQKDQRAAAREEPQPEPDDASEATPAPVANGPADRVAEPETKLAQTPVIRNLVTRNVSNPSEAPQPLLPPDPPANAIPRAEIPRAPTPPEQAASNAQTPAAIVGQRVAQAVAVAETANAADPDMPTSGLLLGAVALLGLVACAVFLVMGVARRRTDVLNTVRDANTLPFETSPEVSPAVEAQTFAPLPPIGLMPREDDVDEALRRFRQNSRRRAA